VKVHLVKITILSVLSLLLLSSCGKEEYNNLTLIDNGASSDTIVVSGKVEVTVNERPVTYYGIYSKCSVSGPDSLATTDYNYLIYGADTSIIAGDIPNNQSVFVLLWATSSGPTRSGTFLAEGFFVEEGVKSDEILCYELTIETTPYSISGSFRTVPGSPSFNVGTFTTRISTCEKNELNYLDLEYTEGRITTFRSGVEKTQMSISIACPDRFELLSDTTRMIFSGGKIEVNVEGFSNVIEEPEFMLLVDVNEVYEFNRPLKAYYSVNVAPIVQGIAPVSYAELIESADEITVQVEFEDEFYIYGTFFGVLGDGNEIEGEFSSRKIAC